jgi:beta-1,4-mannosyltransferase
MTWLRVCSAKLTAPLISSVRFPYFCKKTGIALPSSTSPISQIVVLPDAGPENPFQYEMVRYLRQSGAEVRIAPKRTLFSVSFAVGMHGPAVLYFDWVHGLLLGKSLPLTWIKSLTFLIEILIAKYLRGITLLHTLHNLQNHAGLYLNWEKWVYGFFLKRCNRVRVYSETTKAAAIERFGLKPERVWVIQDLPYHIYYKNQVSKAESRVQLTLPSEAFVYLFFGEIKPYKGLDDFITAFRQTAQPTDRLVIAGKSYDPAYFASLQQLAQDDPRIGWHHRFVEDAEVQVFFNAADVVVLPFRRIDHSGSVDLAMSFSRAVITRRTESMRNLLPNQTELLFENPTELAACLATAKRLDLEAIGKENFRRADSSNYKDIKEFLTPL